MDAVTQTSQSYAIQRLVEWVKQIFSRGEKDKGPIGSARDLRKQGTDTTGSDIKGSDRSKRILQSERSDFLMEEKDMNIANASAGDALVCAPDDPVVEAQSKLDDALEAYREAGKLVPVARASTSALILSRRRQEVLQAQLDLDRVTIQVRQKSIVNNDGSMRIGRQIHIG